MQFISGSVSVLTVIDINKDNQPVIARGEEIAKGLGQEQIIFHVVPHTGNVERATETVEKAVREFFGSEENEPAINIAEEPSIWEENSPSDRVASRIVDETEQESVNYVVIGSRKRSPSRKAVLGNVTQQVLLDTSVPVVVVEQDDDVN